MLSDVWVALRWWGTLFLIGSAAFPFTQKLFARWHDRGYLFSKAIGLAAVSWLVFFAGMTHIAPFATATIDGAIVLLFVGGLMGNHDTSEHRPPWGIIVLEEVFFVAALLIWSWVKAHEPSIRGLEKFMDYGFMNSILHTRYFPPTDMWYPPFSVNYYYFGHLVTAVVTKLSGLDLSYSFNLMLATLFALCLTMSFSLGVFLMREKDRVMGRWGWVRQVIGGVLTAFLVTLAGNMQTIYAFTVGYTGDNVLPFWKLAWTWEQFLTKLPEGMDRYWYANATRFIPYTIHEFPSYSFVVSDIHGHVLSIPFALLAIALLFAFFTSEGAKDKRIIISYGFLGGILLMTNALDGPIYLGLFALLLLVVRTRAIEWREWGMDIAVMGTAALCASMPFLLTFKSFVNGLAVDCPPAFLANMKFGPFLFESVDKCQKSPLWMMWLLWGFFWFCGIILIVAKFIRRERKVKRSTKQSILHIWNTRFTRSEQILIIFFLYSLGLWIFPEFFYFKDIYPMHFRSNTMFKLGYQAFMLCSVLSGYVIMTFVTRWRSGMPRLFRGIVIALFIPQIFLVAIYPYFSIRSYFNGLTTYHGLYGWQWAADEFQDDYAAMLWLNDQPRQPGETIVEADGDSYTEFDKYSVFTGLPTIVGWSVHEWLWRGSYDVVAPRKEEVRQIYEGDDADLTRATLAKYHVRYIIVGTSERTKYPDVQEDKLRSIGNAVFTYGNVTIYEVL
jgi:uncharacterized membrane protein